jgi:hypothetical protein
MQSRAFPRNQPPDRLRDSPDRIDKTRAPDKMTLKKGRLMGIFNEVFKALCDEAFFVSGQEFSQAWNEKLGEEGASIDESTVNRWKDDTLPRQFYLPRIVKLFGALCDERAAAGEGGALGRELRERLAGLCGGDLRKRAAKTSDKAFLGRVIEAAYLSQKNARSGAAPPAGAPFRGGRRARPAAFALAAAGAAVAGGVFILGALLARPPAAVPQQAGGYSPAVGGLETVGPDGLTPLGRAVASGDLPAARRLVAAGAKVNAPLCKGDGRRLDFLRGACEGPISPFPASGRLEDGAPDWGIYWGERLPCFAVSRGGPAGDGRALRLSLLGGEPYAFAHFYANLEPRRRAVRLTVGLRLFLDRETTFNNAGGPSTVQSIEVSVSKFDGKRRYELAWQWENVGEGAPQWRYWDPGRGWTAAGLPQRLELQRLTPRTWHELRFAGKAAGNAVSYDSLSIDGNAFPVNRTAAAAALPDPLEYLAAAVQLDGNFRADPYDVCVEDFTLETAE